ncbi:hypothetical protein B0H34DRAFT_695249 [Crassisporium funariophilum]|nr:hypothetical protein B0H34DRAFT_695249 [Crassisporium funariophilum]
MSTLPSATYSIATATKVNVAHRNSYAKDRSLQRSNSNKRQRDTQALTYALGLASPMRRTDYSMPSPQPTIYPDDSMSVVESKQRNPGDRKQVEAAPPVPAALPMETSNTLMAMQFGVSQMSLSGLATDSADDENIISPLERNGSKRNAPHNVPLRMMERPPRVPSPPALPSLAQMGLAQSNPEAYANYRSPTYSIYGLYETDRTSSFVR